MLRPVIAGLAAIGLLASSAAAMAGQTDRRIHPEDRTQDYLDREYGPALPYDANAYLWDEGTSEALASPVSRDHGQKFGQQRDYYIAGTAPVVTMIMMMPVTTTTTVVTEEIYYETVRRPLRKKVVRKWRPKPRCICS